jgi:3-hydroxybutyryl-CoA dehydratase
MSENGIGPGRTGHPAMDEERCSRGRTITEADLVSFSSLTGDRHPQHADAEWAADGRFGERVAHGMLVLSYAVGLVDFDPERVVALRGLESAVFKRPARIGDTIRVRSRVAAAKPIGDDLTLVTLDWRVVNQEDQLVARARPQALWRTESDTAPDREDPQGECDPADLYGEKVLL